MITPTDLEALADYVERLSVMMLESPEFSKCGYLFAWRPDGAMVVLPLLPFDRHLIRPACEFLVSIQQAQALGLSTACQLQPEGEPTEEVDPEDEYLLVAAVSPTGQVARIRRIYPDEAGQRYLVDERINLKRININRFFDGLPWKQESV